MIIYYKDVKKYNRLNKESASKKIYGIMKKSKTGSKK